MSARRGTVVAIACALALATAAPGVAASPALAAGSPGAPGVGDYFYPQAGNGGYDVSHYRLALHYTPGPRLSGTATISATATQALSRFDLDLKPNLTVASVTVDGRAARSVVHTSPELVITPAAALPQGKGFTVVVRYAGSPHSVNDTDGILDGWNRTDDGAFLANEPEGAATWFPADDHPSDKATYDVSMTVPAGKSVVGNGRLVSQTTSAGQSTFRWVEDIPMTTYLVTATFGNFTVTTGRTSDGIPVYTAVDPREAARSQAALALLPRIVTFEESQFGPYPFDTVGAIVDHAPDLGYALETQTRPEFAAAPNDSVLAHELAHQWFGDSVSLHRWRDIWLNEGFATYAQWLWSPQVGGAGPAELFRNYYSTPASDTEFWNPPPARPGDADHLFAGSVYNRGAMALQALRQRIGDPAFFATLKGWTAAHRHGTGTVTQFEALAGQKSGQDLSTLFTTWLDTPGKPTSW